VYIIQNKNQGNRVEFAELQEVDDKGRQRVAIQYPPLNSESYERLKAALKKQLDDKKSKHPDWTIDRSHPWMEAPRQFHPKMFYDQEKYPWNYKLVGNRWQRKPEKSRPPANITAAQSYHHRDLQQNGPAKRVSERLSAMDRALNSSRRIEV